MINKRDWADELAFSILFTGCDECESATCNHRLKAIAAIVRDVRAQIAQPHRVECNYRHKDIGSEGCICVVLNRDDIEMELAQVRAQALEEACKAICTYCAGEHSRYSAWPLKLRSNQWIHGEIGQILPTSNVSRCAAGLIRDLIGHIDAAAIRKLEKPR